MMAGLESMQDGSYEHDETLKIINLIKKADVFIDVGANMGYYTCIARSMGLKVLAVEPLWHNLQFLYGNLEVNDWPDVEIFPLGLSNKPGLAVLYGVGTAASFIKDWAGISTKKRMVPLSTLDIIAANRFSGLRIVIKIDVEGVEYSVLQGAEAMMSCLPEPVWMVEIGLTGNFPSGVNENFNKVFELFWSKGYSAYVMMPGREDLVSNSQVREWVKKSDTEGKLNFLFRKNG